MASVVAYDLSEEMTAAVARTAAGRGLDNIQTRQGRAERLPFDDHAFDFVATRFSAHHWGDLHAGLREARRVLRPGGWAVIVDGAGCEVAAADTHLQAIELLRDPSHVRDYSTAEWAGALGDVGFVVRGLHRHRLRLEFTSWVERMRTPQVNRDAILALQAGASAEVRRRLAIEPDGSFLLDVVMFEACPG
jgi:SAM-dependent methyltransferase